MNLVAVFIQNPNLDSGGYIINLGGKYHYELVKGITPKTTIKMRENTYFIEDFFDQSKTITNISAIVGNNGSGKTTTLYNLINIFNDTSTKGVTFWEDDNTNYIKYYRIDPNSIVLESYNHIRYSPTKQEVRTIYYSPFLDHKQPANGIDISSDRYLREDLINLRSTFDANTDVLISERLKRADIKRFMNFQRSDFSNKISQKYGLFKDELYRVVFTRHKINIDDSNNINFDNTPRDFHDFLNNLYHKIQQEYKDINRENDSDEQLFTINKELFKNILLMDLFCLLIKLMEKKNTFLLEGHFNNQNALDSFLKEEPDALTQFKYWLNNYTYSKKTNPPLPNAEIINLIEFLYDYIDNIEFSQNKNYFNWTTKSLSFNEKKLEQLLDLNEKLLIALNKYYPNNNGELGSISDLQYFANIEFANRKLSSGETALLNLYSRIYDFFHRHYLNHKVIDHANYHILLLDEADLGYHPSWKRSFVNSLIEFTRELFKKLDSKVQIIFTTHDPLTLSDIPDYSVIYLKNSKVLNIEDQDKPKKTFGANIHELLAESFFIGDGLIGEFAKNKIQDVIEYINDRKELIDLFTLAEHQIQNININNKKNLIDLLKKTKYQVENINKEQEYIQIWNHFIEQLETVHQVIFKIESKSEQIKDLLQVIIRIEQNITTKITINQKDDTKWITSPEVAQKAINLIGEPYLVDKLNDMFLEMFPKFKNAEILKLEEKLRQLKYDSINYK